MYSENNCIHLHSLFSLYSENNFFCYFHCTVKITFFLFSLYSENNFFLLFSLPSRGDIWRHDFIGQKTVMCAHSAPGRRGVVVSENNFFCYFHCTVKITAFLNFLLFLWFVLFVYRASTFFQKKAQNLSSSTSPGKFNFNKTTTTQHFVKVSCQMQLGIYGKLLYCVSR